MSYLGQQGFQFSGPFRDQCCPPDDATTFSYLPPDVIPWLAPGDPGFGEVLPPGLQGAPSGPTLSAAPMPTPTPGVSWKPTPKRPQVGPQFTPTAVAVAPPVVNLGWTIPGDPMSSGSFGTEHPGNGMDSTDLMKLGLAAVGGFFLARWI